MFSTDFIFRQQENLVDNQKILLTTRNVRLDSGPEFQAAMQQNDISNKSLQVCQKATKFCKISTLLLTVSTAVKCKVEILQNFVAFSEYMNFTM